MSVYYEDPEKVDALAEKLLQRAERRILVDNYYTYHNVAKGVNTSNVQGDIYFSNSLYMCLFTNSLSVHLIELHIPLREHIGFKY